MDGRLVGLMGGIAGSVLGVLGGVVGTYFSIKNTNGSRERSFVVRAAVLCWVGVSAFLTCLLLLPTTWIPLLWILFIPAQFWFIRWTNHWQDRARVDDRSDDNGLDCGVAGE